MRDVIEWVAAQRLDRLKTDVLNGHPVFLLTPKLKLGRDAPVLCKIEASFRSQEVSPILFRLLPGPGA